MGHETPPVGVPTIPNAEPAIRRGAERTSTASRPGSWPSARADESVVAMALVRAVRTRARMRSCGWYAPGALKGRPAGALLRVAPLGQVRTRRVVDEPSVTPGGAESPIHNCPPPLPWLAMAPAQSSRWTAG